MKKHFETYSQYDFDDILYRTTREEFEADCWLITRWIQDIQRENGEPVVSDELMEERIRQKADELFGPEDSSPEKELLDLSERVDHMSKMLSEEVSEMLADGLPKTTTELTNLLFHRVSINFRDLYELDLHRMQDYVDAGPHGSFDYYYDSILKTANAIQNVIARLHVICALRDDIREMLRNDYGSEDRTPQYLVLHQLAVQLKNLEYSRYCLSNASKELVIAAEDKDQYTIGGDAKGC